uniref:Uncharacterized protein n=1 Tax=Janibacter limosus TaxID=53458 RepID=A0AC61U948_9MICO|nr:hypothetical protein [Janibacter limosus]
MPSSRRPHAALAGALALPLLLAGCGGSVEVGIPPAADSPACTAAAERWPTDVSGLEPRETTPEQPRDQGPGRSCGRRPVRDARDAAHRGAVRRRRRHRVGRRGPR